MEVDILYVINIITYLRLGLNAKNKIYPIYIYIQQVEWFSTVELVKIFTSVAAVRRLIANFLRRFEKCLL